MRNCDFSREHYEQGAFVKYVMSEERLRRAIRQVPWYDLQNPYTHARSCTTLLGTRNSK